jgi:hypothetical protein
LATMSEQTPDESPSSREENACLLKEDDGTHAPPAKPQRKDDVRPPHGEGEERIGVDGLVANGGDSAGGRCGQLLRLCGALEPRGRLGELLTYGLVVLNLWAVAYLLLGKMPATSYA